MEKLEVFRHSLMHGVRSSIASALSDHAMPRIETEATHAKTWISDISPTQSSGLSWLWMSAQFEMPPAKLK